MKSRSYPLTLDGRGNSVELERGNLIQKDRKIKLVSSSLSMKRKAPVYRILIWFLLIFLIGVVVFSVISMVIFGEGETDPYVEFGDHPEIVFRPTVGYDQTPIYLLDENGTIENLGPFVIYETGDEMDIVRFPDEIQGPQRMGIYFYGDSEFLLERSIMNLRITISSKDRYALQGMTMVTLDGSSGIDEKVDVGPELIDQQPMVGKNEIDVVLDEPYLQQVRLMQRDKFSLEKGTLILISFPEGITESNMSLELEWGPGYYHRTSNDEIALGAIIGVITLGAAAIVGVDLGKSKQVLLVNDGETEHVLTGEEEDLRSLFYEISKVTIKKLKEKEKKDAVPMKGAGITKGSNYLGKKDLKDVKGDLKRSVVINKRVIAQLCPECGNDELYYEGGLMTGHVYHCKRCDYVGSLIFEKELDLADE